MKLKYLSNHIVYPLTVLFAGCLGLFIMASTMPILAAALDEDPHAHHKHMMKQTGYKRSIHSYEIPQLDLSDMDNNKVSLPEALGGEGPVMLNFIFTTCTTICPVLSATFSQVQRELGTEAKNVRMVSVTIDPEQDTPEQLKKYATRFKAKSDWLFLTGELTDIIATQKAFDAYRGDKMNHEPLTFLRQNPNGQWIRLEGFASASEVIAEYRRNQSPR
jgi:protein SCO1/2